MYGEKMDRRQRKTRNAIFESFIGLLSEKNYSKITVGEIIEKADIGRATFYSHFETKDYLLKELCSELFDHIFESNIGSKDAHSHIFDCDAPSSVFLHLFQHLEKNDNNILDLLSGENNELFLLYFKKGLIELVETQFETFRKSKLKDLPRDFLINHIAATFVETVRWWIESKMRQSPEVITEYFLLAV